MLDLKKYLEQTGTVLLTKEAYSELCLSASKWNELQTINPQEPCSDAISRQAVLEYIEGSGAELGHDSENELVCQDIKELPPVIPQPKTGHWIGDNQAFYIYAKCSECGSVHDAKSQYCPTCGCLMEYEEETE